MEKATVRLTVMFEGPFWTGVFECVSGGRLSVCKFTFGSEPKDYEILDFVLKNYYKLKFSNDVAAEPVRICRNPKRMQRQAHKETLSSGIGTKSQQALSLQREQMKTERIASARKRREDEKERLFELKRQKKKEKHRGR